MENKRIEWLDMARGLAMVLVIFVHIDCVPMVDKRMFSVFFLPLFFFVSGYLNPMKLPLLKELLIKRIRTLIIPMWIIVILNMLMSSILTFNDSQTSIAEQILGTFWQISGRNDGMWFISCLFVMEIIFWIIRKISADSTTKILVCVLITSIIGGIWMQFTNVLLPWHLDIACFSIIFFAFGFLYKKYNEKVKNMIATKNIILVFIVYCLFTYINVYLYQNRVDLHMTTGKNFALYVVDALLGILLSVMVLQKIPNLKLLSFVGENSLLYYGFHGKIMRLYIVLSTKFVAKLQLDMNIWMQYVVCLLILILTVITLVIPCIIVNKYLPFIIGKSAKKGERK